MKILTLITYSAVYLLTMNDLADDAYISMRYAWNLWHGNGLVWNPGDYVMGFTNPLFTLIMTIMHALPNPAIMIQLLNLGIVLTMIHLLWEKEGWLAGLLVAMSGSIMIWGQFAMESGLQALCVIMAFYYRKYLLLWLCIAFLVREDGMILAGIGVFYLLTQKWVEGRWPLR